MKELLIEAKKKMKEQFLKEFVEFHKVELTISKSIKICCILHHENTPSMVFHDNDCTFHCYGCNSDYDYINLIMERDKLSFQEAAKKLFYISGINYNPQKTNKLEINKDYKYPTYENNQNKSKITEYLSRRCISKETIDYADLRESNGNIVFNYYNENNVLLLVKYRPARKIKKGELKSWCQKNSDTSPILFNMNRIDVTKPLIITEGEIDCLSLIECGYRNAVSVPFGAKATQFIEYNYEWLNQFEKIIIWTDSDKPGRELKDEIISRLGNWRCYYVESEEKDCNLTLFRKGKEYVIQCINTAKDIQDKDIIPLMSYDDFDLQKTKKIPFAYNSLNRLMWGMLENTFSIWTGPTGNGKSTVVTQNCILEAIEHGYKAFIFSGELVGGHLKNWLIHQASTRNHIIEFDNGKNSPKGYRVTGEFKKTIENWAMDKIYFYENFLDIKPTSIIEKMEFCYKKHGVKVFTIDNLMCVDFSDYQDDFKAQTGFMLDLLKFTAKYGVYVNLVAHPRKPNGQVCESVYDVAGTSNIVNLCHRILYVKRDDDKKRTIITILKDRMCSASGSIELKYDIPTKRLYSDDDELWKKYSWDTGSIKYKTTKFGQNGTLLQNIKEQNNENRYSEIF